MPWHPQRFTARVRKQGTPNFVEVPVAVSAAFAEYTEKGHVRVHGKLRDAEIRSTWCRGVAATGGARVSVATG